MSLRIGSLFSGYGGLDLAIEQALGGTVAWVSEVDPKPAHILAARYPDAPNLGDITAVDWSSVEPVDVIGGGSPCQDLSNAGGRAGMRAGTRSGLWSSMCDAVEAIRPRLVVWENVRGALSAPATAGNLEHCEFCVGDVGDVHMRALGRVLGDLSDLGYDAAWAGLRAADVGAPHARWRVFVVAWPATDPAGDAGWIGDGDGGTAAAGFAPHGLAPDLALMPTPQAHDHTAGKTSEQVDDMRSRTGAGVRNLNEVVVNELGPLLPTPAVNDMGAAYDPGSWDEWTARMKAAHGNGNGHGKSLHIEALRLLPTPMTTDSGSNSPGDNARKNPSLRTMPNLVPTPKAGDADLGRTAMTRGRPLEKSSHLGSRVALLPTPRASDGDKGGPNQRGSSGDLMLSSAVQQFGEYAPAVMRWEQVLGRLAPDPTEPTGKDGAPRLSARFVEWMMGLPDGWVTDPEIWPSSMTVSARRNAQLKALGNGVVPQQGAAVIRWLLGMRSQLVGV